MSDYRNHSKNSLRSDSFSCRFACLAHAVQESKTIPIRVHPINTSSCGMFLGLLSFSLISLSSLVHRLPHIVLHVSSLRSKTFLAVPSASRLPHGASCLLTNVRKHSARGGLQRNANSLNRYWVSDCGAIWATKYEKLFERSEFFEWFEEFVFRPPSSGRFRTFLCFVSFSDERNENLLHT